MNELKTKLEVLMKLNALVETGLAKAGDVPELANANEKVEIILKNLQSVEHEYSEIINSLVRNQALTLEEVTSGME